MSEAVLLNKCCTLQFVSLSLMQCTTVLLLLTVGTRCSIHSDAQDYQSVHQILGLKDFNFIMKTKSAAGNKKLRLQDGGARKRDARSVRTIFCYSVPCVPFLACFLFLRLCLR